MSLCASNETTSALYSRAPKPGICTDEPRSPATTCAAVTTRSGSANQPLPSMPMPQAVPRIFTTELLALRMPGLAAIAGLGGAAGAAGPAGEGEGCESGTQCGRPAGGG